MIVLIEWTGIDVNTDFVSVSLPAKLSVLPFQPVNFDETLSNTSLKVSLLIRFCNTGIPRYLSSSLVDFIPLSAVIKPSRSLDTLFEKKNLGFLQADLLARG